MDDISVEVDAVRVDHGGRDARDEDEDEISRPALVLVTVDASHPVHGLDERRDTDRHQAEKESAMQVRPRDHHEREPVDRSRFAAEVAVEPQHLEAGEGERDHLRTRPPDLGAAEAGDADHDRGDHEVGVLEADAPPDEQEPGERHGPECD